MSNRTVNLKDVAAKAGVSITTVSHVINKLDSLNLKQQLL